MSRTYVNELYYFIMLRSTTIKIKTNFTVWSEFKLLEQLKTNKRSYIVEVSYKKKKQNKKKECS